MTATFLIPSLIFILLGSACVIYPRQIGIRFFKLGKWSWKTKTLGLTDMRWFYQEDKATPGIRLLGAAFLLVGVVFLMFVLLSFGGPGSLYAMREASGYLKQRYGDAEKWSISARSENDGGTLVTITYSYGPRSGKLTGKWDGQRYVFTEKE